MKLIFPILSLGASAFAIIWTPWPTAKEVFSPRSIEWIQDAPVPHEQLPQTTIAWINEFQ